MHVSEIFDPAILWQHIDAKLVRVREHPSQPWRIYNYTETCAWSRAWDDVTLQCRGLVLDSDCNVVARPFPKFFNYGEPGAAEIALDDRVLVTDKADGSLGILLPDGTLATRGSFISEQAQWATEFYRETYADRWEPHPGITFMFEIIYPENRIVVDYHGMRDLMLLGAINIDTGDFIAPHIAKALAGWQGPTVSVFAEPTLAKVLEAPERPNAEGFVVTRLRDGARLKIKFEDYKRLHRLVTQVTPRHVWECLSVGIDPDVEFAGAPDEFYDWLKLEVATLRHAFESLHGVAHAEYLGCLDRLPDGFDRKDFAALAVECSQKSAVFNLLDGKQIDGVLWKQLRPAADRTMRMVTADAD